MDAVRYYRILGLDVEIRSDSQGFLSRFDRDYDGFRSEPGDGIRFDVRLLSDPATVSVVFGDRTETSAIPGQKGFLALPFVLGRILDALPGFLFLHAAVVEGQGGAWIIAGPPGSGKTTLALGLVEKGRRLFSDDFCPVHLETGRIHPFPRSLWVDGKPGDGPSAHGKKAALSALDLGERLAQAPAPPAGVILMDPGPEREKVLHLYPAKDAEKLVADLAAAGAQAIPPEDELSPVRAAYPPGSGVPARVKAVLDSWRPRIWDSFSVVESGPDFTGVPRLSPVPAHKAAFSLLGDLKSRAALKTPGSGPLNLFERLLEILAPLPCHTLTPGPQEDMQALALSLLKTRAETPEASGS